MLYLAAFLLIVAVAIAIIKPKTKIQVWLYGILIPIAFAFIFGFCLAVLSGSTLPLNGLWGHYVAKCVPSTLISIVPLVYYLKQKYDDIEKFEYPKLIIFVIVICAIVGAAQLIMSYQADKALEQYIESKKQGVY